MAKGDNRTDTIYNFQLGQTQIGLADGWQFSDLTISQGNHATLISTGEDFLGSLVFVPTTIDASRFITI
ncbi:MAG: hypothetical protein ABI417_18135 [Coleofasciculaceae cyanobacterium]